MRMYLNDFNDKFKPFWAKWGKIIALIWAVSFFIVAHAGEVEDLDEFYRAPFVTPKRMTTPDHLTFTKYCMVGSKTHGVYIKEVDSIGLHQSTIAVGFRNERTMTMNYNNVKIARLAYQELKAAMDVCAFYHSPFEK